VKPKRLLLLISYFSSWIYYKKHGLKIDSTKTEAGDRVYSIKE